MATLLQGKGALKLELYRFVIASEATRPSPILPEV